MNGPIWWHQTVAGTQNKIANLDPGESLVIAGVGQSAIYKMCQGIIGAEYNVTRNPENVNTWIATVRQ